MGKPSSPKRTGTSRDWGQCSPVSLPSRRHGSPGGTSPDQDATFIETEERGANWNYKGEKSYQALNTYCPEYDLVAGTRWTATGTSLPAGSSRTNWNGSLKAYLRK